MHLFKTYFIELFKTLTDTFGKWSFLAFVLTTILSFVPVQGDILTLSKKISPYLAVFLLFIIVLRGGYKAWKESYSASIDLEPKIYIMPKNLFQLSNENSLHPDSQGMISFEFNISNETESDITLTNVSLENLSNFFDFFQNKKLIRILDCQGNYRTIYFPIKVEKGGSEQIFVEFAYDPIEIEKQKSHDAEEPAHIMQFAKKLHKVSDFEVILKFEYISRGNKLSLNIKKSLFY